MSFSEAQADVRRVYHAGFHGPLISAVLWATASAVFTWRSPAAGMAVLFFGGMLIFPVTTLILKIMAGPTSLPKGHPSAALALQAALTVPLGLLVAVVLGAYEPSLFFPASLIIVGAHYLVFVSLYGMKLYATLAAAMILPGMTALFLLPGVRPVSGWIGALILSLFAAAILYQHRHEPLALAAPSSRHAGNERRSVTHRIHRPLNLRSGEKGAP
ncbi:hypothetical protein IWX63_003077 [Arthrobacter sp. CAN_A2]|uniref:DUF7010 family protein n=1 Tax=Arthrobacter sp. CAN_A2 TaxID=2787718 RepID=UPI0018F00A06